MVDVCRKRGNMRTTEEMMKLIMDTAINDDRIRAVTMEGSRVSPNATHDQYCDFDITYVVSDIREFTKDKSWVECFGEILIVQYPCDWYSEPYDYAGHEKFAYLIQFKDGNRIDLTLMDVRNIKNESEYNEPRQVLLNKDNFVELKHINDESVFHVKKPSEMEFYNTCNEFRWLSVYVSKGLCREELYYAKHAYDVPMMDMFIKMLNWKIGIDNDFKITTGNHSKYLKRFLTSEDMERFHGIFPNGTYEDIWNKLFLIYDYFVEIAQYVGNALGFEYDENESKEVRGFLQERYIKK